MFLGQQFFRLARRCRTHARTAPDLRILLNVLAGPDPASFSVPAPVEEIRPKNCATSASAFSIPHNWPSDSESSPQSIAPRIYSNDPASASNLSRSRASIAPSTSGGIFLEP